MKLRLGRWALALMMAAAPAALPQQTADETGQEDTHLPNGKLQRDEILKADYEQNLKDAARLSDLAQQLQVELQKGDRFVLSLDTLKKTDEIEKLAKKIRSRLRHY